MRLFYKLSILLFTTILIFSCREDLDESTITNVTIPGPEIITLITGDLDVYITDISGMAMENVDVFVYDEKMRTDKFGIVQFRNIALDGNGTFVRAYQEGYFFGSDKFFPSGDGSNSIVIRMLPLDNAKEIDPASASQIAVDGGGSIKFQANSFVNSNNEDYTGVVTVFAKRINPEAPFSHEVMPGNLFGVNERGNAVVLESYAMLAVELRDKDGNELNLKEGLPATVSFEVDDKLKDAAPQFIPTWSFDEVQGNWIEEGEAELIDGNYVAEVAHFSFWNCDAPYPLVNITGTVVDNNGNPQDGFYVLVKTNGMCGAGYTNSEGVFSGKMPKNQLLTFCVFAPGCNDPIYTETLGPFTENTQLEDFVIESNTATYAGVVLCEGQPLAGADIYLTFPNINEKYVSNEDGTFSISVNQINCQGIGDGSLFALDPATGIISEMIIVNSEDQLDLQLEVCINCDVTSTINVDAGDICGSEATLTIVIDNPITTFNYEWTTGETTESITVDESGTYCVEVTEPITECSFTICEVIEIQSPFGAEITGNVFLYCSDPGFISAQASGGTAPYQYLWDGPGVTGSTDQSLTVFDAGVYTVTITDSNGCTAVTAVTVEVFSGTNDLLIYVDGGNGGYFCQGDEVVLSIDDLYFQIDPNQVTWILPDGSTEMGGSIVTSIEGYYQAMYFDGICDYFGDITIIEQVGDYEFSEYGCDGDHFFLTFENSVGNVFESFITDTAIYNNFPEIYDGLVAAPSNTCSTDSIAYSIPFATGINLTTISEATCDTCTDGYVEFNSNDFSCNCTLDEIYVASQNSPWQNLNDANDAQELPSGTYFLLARAQEGCLIYVEKFEL